MSDVRVSIDPNVTPTFEQVILADIGNDLVTKAVWSGFETAFQRSRSPQTVNVTNAAIAWDPDNLQSARTASTSEFADVAVMSEFRFAPSASALRVHMLDLRRDDHPIYSDVLLLGTTSSFGAIEEELSAVTRRLAERVRDGAVAKITPVLVYCINPGSADEQLTSASVKLTLELPSVLANMSRSRGLSFDFVGLNQKDFYAECGGFGGKTDAPNAVRFEQFDYVISGRIMATRRDFMLEPLLDSRLARYSTPVPTTAIPRDLGTPALEGVAEVLLKELTNAADRPSE